MRANKISLDALIEIVANGGKIKTGIDIFNKQDVLILEKNVLVEDVNILFNIKKNGILEIPFNQDNVNGVWDRSGTKIIFNPPQKEVQEQKTKSKTNLDLEARIEQINEEKKEASIQYKKAQAAIGSIFSDIRQTEGTFDTSLAYKTVTNLVSYVAQNNNAVAYLINEILSYDSYLHNHSVNVCILATAVLNKFEHNYEEIKADFLTRDAEDFSKEDIPILENNHQKSVAFFLHDVGKVLIDEKILKKEGPLTTEEFAEVKKHSYEKGVEILQKNNITNVYAKDIVTYHHAALYSGDENCYPGDKTYNELPSYVKICKLADIYDAMTSKRCYKEAQNPTWVMSEMYNKYVNKDKALQLILHSFINVVGICPSGSIVFLSNGQLAYVLDGNGPLLIPFTDTNGSTLTAKLDPIDFGDKKSSGELTIDKQTPIVFPLQLYNKLPPYLKTAVL
jgi:HD-GYP domain-containing protein (c-di-GMP phosphodiesterase class II)